MPIYHKLVRDEILNILDEEGLTYTSRVLEPAEHLAEIKKKLHEEVQEFDESVTVTDEVEELADILELIHAALKVQGKSFEELEAVRVAKREQRGGFDQGLYLVEVVDK